MIFETIKKVLIEDLDLDPDIILEKSMVEKDLELDSTESVIISLALKKKYGIDYVFPREDISLGDICNTVLGMLAAKEKF